MSIRPAAPDDAEAIAHVWVAAWRATYADSMPREYLAGLDVAERRADFQRMLSGPAAAQTFVALDARGTVVGFCRCGASRDEDARGRPIGELIVLNVAPLAWGQGHGRALCDAAFALARTQGQRRLTLWTLHGNARAQRFYLARGFHPDGREKRVPHPAGFEMHQLRYARDLEDETR